MSDSPYNNHFYASLLEKLIDADYARFDKMEEGDVYCRPTILGEQDVSADAYCDYVFIIREPGTTKPTRLFVTGEQALALRLAPEYCEYH